MPPEARCMQFTCPGFLGPSMPSCCKNGRRHAGPAEATMYCSYLLPQPCTQPSSYNREVQSSHMLTVLRGKEYGMRVGLQPEFTCRCPLHEYEMRHMCAYIQPSAHSTLCRCIALHLIWAGFKKLSSRKTSTHNGISTSQP